METKVSKLTGSEATWYTELIYILMEERGEGVVNQQEAVPVHSP